MVRPRVVVAGKAVERRIWRVGVLMVVEESALAVHRMVDWSIAAILTLNNLVRYV